MKIKDWLHNRKNSFSGRLQKMMKCIWSGEHLRIDETIASSSESLATRDYSATASGFSSRPGEPDRKIDTSNIEEAESSLRESGYLNYEEARALLGRLEYQKGNVEAALHVFEGIDIAAVIPKIKVSIARRCEFPRRFSQSDAAPPLSMHAVSLLFEAILLKAKSLMALQKFTEAAQSCKLILDTVEAAVPEGLPENFASGSKFADTLSKTVELLPELWKLADVPQETILSYRRALLYHWNLDMETRSKLEKEFATFLLYSGCDAAPPNHRSQAEGSFIPTNNIEEAVLLLLFLLRKSTLNRIIWDPSVLDHLVFALSIAGELRTAAHQIEELSSGTIEEKDKYTTLALCYYGEGDSLVALNLLTNILNNRENHNCIFELLLASKICGEIPDHLEEGTKFARKVISHCGGKCAHLASVAYYLLGISLSAQSQEVASDSKKLLRQAEALEALEMARKMSIEINSNVLYHLSLEYAEQRKLDAALYYAKILVRNEAGYSLEGWILLARILSAKKRYVDAENIVNAALDETGKWDQGELLQTKGKLQIAQGHLREAIETYTHLLAVFQVQKKSYCVHNNHLRNRRNDNRSLEMETWHGLANLYTRLSQWQDAEVCLLKSEAINPHSASRLHSTGLLYEAKGLKNEALKCFEAALGLEPSHVPSLISVATILQQLGNNKSRPIVKSFLTDALRIDRTNPSAWYNLGLLYKSEVGASIKEAVECFEASTLLQETSPVEPFR